MAQFSIVKMGSGFAVDDENGNDTGATLYTAGEARMYRGAREDGKNHDEAMDKVLKYRISREKARNRNRASSDAMKSCGMVKTPFGWE